MQFGYIITYLIGAFGTLYGWLNPAVGLLVYYVFATLQPTLLWHWSFPAGAAPRFGFYVGLSTLLGWALVSFGRWSGLRALAWPLAGLAVYLASGLVAWQLCDQRPDLAWQALAAQLRAALMLLVALTLLREPWQVRGLAGVMAAVLGYLAWVTASQHFAGWSPPADASGDRGAWPALMVAGLPLALLLGLYDARPWVKAPCLVAALLMAYVALVSGSPGAALALAFVGVATLAAALLLLPHRRLTLALVAVGVTILLHMAGADGRQRLLWPLTGDEAAVASVSGAMETWDGALRCLRDRPMGVGPANFSRVSDRYGLPVNSPARNVLLHTAVNYGIAGAAGLAVFFAGAWWHALRLSLSRSARRQGWPGLLGAAMALSLAGLFLAHLFEPGPVPDAAYALAAVALCTSVYFRRAAAAQDARAAEAPADAPAPPEAAPA